MDHISLLFPSFPYIVIFELPVLPNGEIFLENKMNQSHITLTAHGTVYGDHNNFDCEALSLEHQLLLSCWHTTADSSKQAAATKMLLISIL